MGQDAPASPEVLTHPTLPGLPAPPARSMAGPTPWSNWVIPGQVLAGAYPASLDDVETDQILTMLLELGVNTFVCLQAEVNIHVPEHVWRAGHGLRPYIRDAQRILSRAHEASSSRITQQKIDFLHLPIIDGNVTTDSAMHRLVEDVSERVLRGEKMYIHCWGGHGRTGTLVAVMLARLYCLPCTNALRYTQAFHDSRVYPQGVQSPQTPVQRAQVRRLCLQPSNTLSAMKAAYSARGLAASPGPGTTLPGPITPAKPSVLPSSLARYKLSSARAADLASSPIGGGQASSAVERLRAAAAVGLGAAPGAPSLRLTRPQSGGAAGSRAPADSLPAAVDRLGSDLGRLQARLGGSGAAGADRLYAGAQLGAAAAAPKTPLQPAAPPDVLRSSFRVAR